MGTIHTFNKVIKLKKRKIHITHHCTPNNIYAHAFCHTGIENLLKGPEVRLIKRITVRVPIFI